VNTQANPKISPPGGEPELVTRARAGDREAFASLYNDHRDQVFRYIRFRVRDRHLAEDLTQEAFIRALRNVGTFTWKGVDFAGWLTTIARNLVADHFKAARTRREISTAEMLDAAEQDRSAEDRALSELEAVEAQETVRMALAGLNDYQRECVRLRYLDELSVGEAAAVMGRKEGAVKGLLYRAMRTMEQQVRQADAEAVAA
jgi:RNA polymerase sigma-70 factor (ECF subfamily)